MPPGDIASGHVERGHALRGTDVLQYEPPPARSARKTLPCAAIGMRLPELLAPPGVESSSDVNTSLSDDNTPAHSGVVVAAVVERPLPLERAQARHLNPRFP